MANFFLLLSPRIIELKNSLLRSDRQSGKRTSFMILIGLAFWIGLFILSSHVLFYFQSIDVIGDLLAHYLLEMLLLTFFSLLIFSHIINGLSILYLSNDLELYHSVPADPDEVFLSRIFLTLLESSWMVMVFGIPILMAFAYVYHPSPWFYVNLVHSGLALIIITAGLGGLFDMILVCIFPAHRTRDIIMLLVILVLIALYLMFRLLQPERLVDPDAFFSIVQYLNALEGPKSPYLPTHWVSEVLWANLRGLNLESYLFKMILLWSTALSLIFINLWIARGLYFVGFSKSQEAKRRRIGYRIVDKVLNFINKPLGQDTAIMIAKDIRIFFRDNSQWSQLLLLGALIIVYLYNFSVLPLTRSPVKLEFLQNELAFLNMGLAGFVLSAISVRFVFSSVSAEGNAFWIIKSSPITLKKLLWIKYILYILPMTILGEILIVATNYLLNVTPLMMMISSLTILLAVSGIVSLGIGLGAVYPKFRHQNIAEVATGFGGVLYMIICTVFLGIVILLEAGPVYILFMADMKGRNITSLEWIFIFFSFVLVLFIMIISTYLPMRMGVKSLEEFE